MEAKYILSKDLNGFSDPYVCCAPYAENFFDISSIFFWRDNYRNQSNKLGETKPEQQR